MINNFEELKQKANYCLNCKVKPCSNKGCPLYNDIPTFINLAKNGEFEKAYEIITKTSVLPSICGRICPHYKQCQGSCIRGIKGNPVSIGEIEAFIGDMAIKHNYNIKKFDKQDLYQKNIAVIGGGPSGLTVSSFLARRGANITIYEKYSNLGGILTRGIPEFRLPKNIVEKSIDKILALGINVKYNMQLGKDFKLDDIKNKYDAIILAFGANVSNKMNINGEDLKGVYGANEFLEGLYNINFNGKTVVVNGGGNVAIDAARTAKSKGAKNVFVTYRRSKNEMPAEKKEVEDAINENIEFLFQNNIVKIIGNNQNQVSGVQLIKTELVKNPNDNRLTPVNIENSDYTINADYVIMALGSHPANFVKNLGLELKSNGKILTNEFGQTSIPNVYAIGDLADNKSTVAFAAKSARIVGI